MKMKPLLFFLLVFSCPASSELLFATDSNPMFIHQTHVLIESDTRVPLAAGYAQNDYFIYDPAMPALVCAKRSGMYIASYNVGWRQDHSLAPVSVKSYLMINDFVASEPSVSTVSAEKGRGFNQNTSVIHLAQSDCIHINLDLIRSDGNHVFIEVKHSSLIMEAA